MGRYVIKNYNHVTLNWGVFTSVDEAHDQIKKGVKSHLKSVGMDIDALIINNVLNDELEKAVMDRLSDMCDEYYVSVE